MKTTKSTRLKQTLLTQQLNVIQPFGSHQLKVERPFNAFMFLFALSAPSHEGKGLFTVIFLTTVTSQTILAL